MVAEWEEVTVLLVACDKKDEKAAGIVLEVEGVDVNHEATRTEDGAVSTHTHPHTQHTLTGCLAGGKLSAMVPACTRGSLPIVKRLLGHGAAVDQNTGAVLCCRRVLA